MRPLIFIVLVLLTTIGCKKLQLIGIDGVQKIEIKNCFHFSKPSYVVDSATDFDTVFTQALRENCNHNDLPFINLEEKTILGLRTNLDYVANFDYEVNAVVDKDEFIYSVIATKVRPLDTEIELRHWITIPKLPIGFSVSFELIED